MNKKDRTQEECIAITIYENYEKFSEEENKGTQKSCKRKDFDDLPESNKKVMIKMAKWILLIEDLAKQETAGEILDMYENTWLANVWKEEVRKKFIKEKNLASSNSQTATISKY